MSSFGQEIKNVVSGEPFKIERDVYGIPEGVVIQTAGFRVFVSETEQSDTNALIKTDITTTPSTGGQILDDDSDSNGVGLVSFILEKNARNAWTIIEPTGLDNDIKFSAVTAGQGGNKITITYVDLSAVNASLSLSVAGTALTVYLATNGSGQVTTTANDIIAAISASTEASALVSTELIGTGTGVVTAIATVNLANGNGGTLTLTPGTKYYYRIIVKTSQDDSSQIIEAGTLLTKSEIDVRPTVAATTSARAAQTTSERVNLLIDQYLDAILHEFRQLRVWDEHARRTSNDCKLLRLTYRHLNPSFYPEVWTGQNEKLEANDFEVEYDSGALRVVSTVRPDSGYEDYFVTYEFDLFPAKDLEILLNLTLQELNLAGAANGGYITNYATIDSAPPYWDAPLVYGTLTKAFNRLASDSALWKNFLIWADSAQTQGPQIAKESASYYNEQMNNLTQSLKKLHLVASPSSSFDLFRQVGFGFFAVGGSKFRELRINRLSIH